jgi:hypothetical protein
MIYNLPGIGMDMEKNTATQIVRSPLKGNYSGDWVGNERC